MKTTAKIICFVICCVTLAISQRTNAQPVFQAASIDSAPLGNRIPLILIHGIEEDSSIWNNFTNYYATHSALQNNFKPYFFAYQTDQGSMTPSDPSNIFGLVPKLGNDLEQTFGTKSVAILAHSMGGLVARAEMEYYSYADKTRGGDRTLILITLATPHHGSPLGNDFIGAYVTFTFFWNSFTPITWVEGLSPGFGWNLEWDGYDGNNINGDAPISAIPSSQDYPKIVVYGGAIASDSSIPSQDQNDLKPGYDIISVYHGYNNDGAVPIGSALFRKANSLNSEDGIRVRQVDGTCDHREIYSGQKTVNGGTPIFDSIAADLATVVPISTPSPVIASLSPSTLVASTSPQTIEIIGSGFTSGSTLLVNGNAPTSGTVTFVNGNEIDYRNTFATAGTRSVQIVNSSQTSNSKNFTVNTQQLGTGSLVVNLLPANIGGQWQVNGTYYNSGDLANPLTPGQYTVTFKYVSGYTSPASFAVNIIANAQTTTNATYTPVAPTTYTLTLNANATQGSVSASPSASGGIYNSGSVVQLTAYANIGYHFTGWSGDLSGSISQTNITMNSSKNITANFASGDPNLATVTVTIKPDPAANAGVTWSVTGDSQLRASGTSLSEAVGSGYTTYLPVTLNLVAGWLGTNGTTSFYIPITAGTVTNVTLTCVSNSTPGLLTVTLSPPDAVNAGAHWHVNGGTYGQGASVSLTPGNYAVTFDAVSGWTAPASQQVTMQPSQTIALSGNYTPPAGQPAIISISPPIGPMSGGTLMTISGANFAATTNVLIGGKSGSNIVVSATQITCLTPSSTTNGSVPVIVQATGGSATNPNGFAYGMARGNKLDLVSAIGGSCFGITVNGNYAYIGEGRNFLILDISQSPPSKVGSKTLPGLIKGIALLPPNNQYAYVADEEGGLQVVDVSSPTAPRLAGFYSTTNQLWSAAISIFGGRAYVADETAGLQIFDLSNPTAPALLSSTSLGGGEAVIVKASSNGVFAYVSTWGNLCIVDVSNPLLPILRGQTSINNGAVFSIALSGNYVYAASVIGNLEIIDVSNTNAPVDVGHAANPYSVYSVASANGLIYAAQSAPVSYQSSFYVFSPSGSSLTMLGQTTNTSSTGFNMLVSGTKAYVAAGASGFVIVDVSNPYSPNLSSSFSDSGVFGQYESVAITGNSLAAYGNGINATFNVSNPSKPSFAANLNANGSYVLANNGLAYVLNGNSNFIFNISTPSSPSLVKLFPNGGHPISMSLMGNMLYEVGYSDGSQPYLAAIDVSTPASPIIRGTKTFTEFNSTGASAFAANGTKALIGMFSPNEVITLDLSNIASPTEKGAITNLPYYPKAIQISQDGNYGYVLMGGSPSSLYVLNVSQPTSLTIVTNVPLDAAGGIDLKIQGNELYVATYRGLYVFDISNPALPGLIRTYSILSEIQGIGISSDSISQAGYIYLATQDGGIAVLREQDTQSPDVYITDPIFGSTWPTTSSSTELGGSSDDNVGVTAITWSNNRGGSGQVSPPLDSWYVPSIALYPGTNILTVTAFDAAGNSGTDSLAVIYQTANQNQTITFPAIANHTFGDAPITLDAAASSGLPVTFSVVSGPATLTSSNVLTLNGAGTVTVQASQLGNSSYNPAHVNQRQLQRIQGKSIHYICSGPQPFSRRCSLCPRSHNKFWLAGVF